MKLCGITLERGQYHLVLHERLADIYRGQDLLVTAKEKVTPLGRHDRPNIVYGCGSVLMKVNFKKVKVLFSKPPGKPVVNEEKTKTLH